MQLARTTAEVAKKLAKKENEGLHLSQRVEPLTGKTGIIFLSLSFNTRNVSLAFQFADL